jgi:signal transduction histidine kinase
LLAELLQQGDIPPLQVQQFGSRTVREADRLARLVDSILRYAQLEHGRIVSPEILIMTDLVDAARESLAPVMEERGHVLRVHNLAPSGRVHGERDALVSVVAELLDNASKYGAAESGIDVTLRSEAARMRLEVSDRGPGIATEDRERVFLPFHRLGNELVREQKGVGLGLALVQGIIVAHRGQVGCIAREGGGTTFWLELPAVPDSPDTTP